MKEALHVLRVIKRVYERCASKYKAKTLDEQVVELLLPELRFVVRSPSTRSRFETARSPIVLAF